MVLADKQSMMMRGEREREELQNELDKTRTNLRYIACVEVSCWVWKSFSIQTKLSCCVS